MGEKDVVENIGGSHKKLVLFYDGEKIEEKCGDKIETKYLSNFITDVTYDWKLIYNPQH